MPRTKTRSKKTSMNTSSSSSFSSSGKQVPPTTIWYFNFEELPLEIRVQILCFCSDETLMNVSTTNKLYQSLILGKEGDDDFLSGYRNAIWKARLLQMLNNWIDEANLSAINNGIDTSQLENFTEKNLDYYIEKQVVLRKNFRYRDLVMSLKRISFKYQEEAKRDKSETGVIIRGRYIRNNNITEWNSFLCENYFMANEVDMLSKNQIAFRGYELIISEYYICKNTWRFVLGIGTDYSNFNMDKSTTQFLNENHGVGFIVENQRVKSFGSLSLDSSNLLECGPIKVGDRYGLFIDFEKSKVYFFKNGMHIMTVSECIDKTIVYHPIIAMCPKKSCTLYPLFTCGYPLNAKAPERLIEENKL